MARVTTLFSTIGDTVEVPENMIDPLTSISGSGSAYVFYFIEKLTDADVARGFSRDDARRLVRGTIRRSVALLDETGTDPVERGP
jgi:pyrroline-5-carboxylate reductase